MGIVRGIVEIVLAIVEVLLVLRLLLVLFNANAVGFAASIFAWTDPLLAPVGGIFPVSGALFLILIAMVVYGIIGGIIAAIFSFLP